MLQGLWKMKQNNNTKILTKQQTQQQPTSLSQRLNHLKKILRMCPKLDSQKQASPLGQVCRTFFGNPTISHVDTDQILLYSTRQCTKCCYIICPSEPSTFLWRLHYCLLFFFPVMRKKSLKDQHKAIWVKDCKAESETTEQCAPPFRRHFTHFRDHV